jgi:hypothetical protein
MKLQSTRPSLRSAPAQVRPAAARAHPQGQWQRELAQRKVDIIAFDNFATLRPSGTIVGTVTRGNDDVLPQHPDRALLLCYPPVH